MNENAAATITWIAIGLFIVFPVSMVFAFSPQTVVRLQAKLYRTAYKSILKEPFECTFATVLMIRFSGANHH